MSSHQNQIPLTFEERFHEIMDEVLKKMSIGAPNVILESYDEKFYFLSLKDYEIYSYYKALKLKIEHLRFFPMRPDAYEIVFNYIDVSVIKKVGYIPREDNVWREFINI